LIQRSLLAAHRFVVNRPTKRITMITADFQYLGSQSQPRAAVYGLLLYHHSNAMRARSIMG
jgi:hypothetical protein